MQRAGFILNRIYFNYSTSTKGTTPTGSGPYTDVQIYNKSWVGAKAHLQITTAFASLKLDHSIRRHSCNLVSHDLFPRT